MNPSLDTEATLVPDQPMSRPGDECGCDQSEETWVHFPSEQISRASQPGYQSQTFQDSLKQNAEKEKQIKYFWLSHIFIAVTLH